MLGLPRYHLEKPDPSKMDRKKASRVFNRFSRGFKRYFDRMNSPQYLYWTEFKYKKPFEILNSEETWLLTRELRNLLSKKTPIRAESGGFFNWIRLPDTDEFLHRIDMYAGAQIALMSSASMKNQQLIIRGVMEEAIASSQLEGAHTTRSAAKKMLMEGRAPRNESETMIVNNYRAMLAIEENFKDSDLSLDLIFELHQKLTENTLPQDQQGRLRENADEIVVQGEIGNENWITHVPPRENFLNREIKRLIDFANDQEGERFVHPIIKAIFLHFWVAYLHPFTDGNGRLARALFYWYLLKKGYWTIMYLPISMVIKKAPNQYAMSYVYSEQDHFDLTYFYDFHLRKIIQALDEFESYLQKQVQESRDLDEILGEAFILNERQKRLINYFASDGDAASSVSSYAEINKITRQTSAKDLKELEMQELLSSRREGKFVRYRPTLKLKKLLKKV